ncbi:MAG: UDP-N-acetylmuramate dehydrogenase [Bacillota bacterium]
MGEGMLFTKITEDLAKVTMGRVLLAEPMSKHTSFRIGGPAEILVVPKEVGEISALIGFAEKKGLPFTLLGNCSNVLVKDKGISGLVIKLAGGPKRVSIEDNNLIAEAGALMPRVSYLASFRGLSGLEFMAGIPGSIGGGLVMNAGAHGQSMSQVVTWVETVNQDGVFSLIPSSALNLGYRNSNLQGGFSFVAAVHFKLEEANQKETQQKRERNLAVRRAKQPLSWPSAGSIFVNPKDKAAGFLLDQAGLKGRVRGGAEISQKHANFIVNKGGATAEDVLRLIGDARELVFKSFGIELQLEIKIVGDD